MESPTPTMTNRRTYTSRYKYVQTYLLDRPLLLELVSCANLSSILCTSLQINPFLSYPFVPCYRFTTRSIPCHVTPARVTTTGERGFRTHVEDLLLYKSNSADSHTVGEFLDYTVKATVTKFPKDFSVKTWRFLLFL